MKFDVEAARKAGYSDDEILEELAKTSKFDVQRSIAAGYSKPELINHLAKATNAPAPEPGMLEQAAQAGKDFLGGIGSGVFSTVRGAANLVGLPQSEYLNKLATAPASRAGQAGQFVEQAGEFILPGGLVARGATRLGGAGRLGQLAARTGLEALSSGAIAGVQSGGDPEAARNAVLLGGGMTAATGVAAPYVADRLARSATNLYGKVLNPTMRTTKYTSRTQTIPGMLERRVTAGSIEGLLERAQNEAQHWGQAVEDAWAAVPQNTTLQVQPLLQAIDDSVAQGAIRGQNLGPVADTMMNHAHEMRDVITNLAHQNPATGALEITVGDLRQLRQFSDMVAARSGAYAGRDIADQSLAAIYETTGNAARNQINQAFPHVEQANQQFNFWRNAERVADETVQRRVGQERGLLRTIGNTIGASTGGMLGKSIGGTEGAVLGTVIGTGISDQLQKAMTSTAWRSASAVTKQRLADALAQGNMGAVEFYLGKILGSTAAAKTTGDERRKASR